jgi:hypothetical protein
MALWINNATITTADGATEITVSGTLGKADNGGAELTYLRGVLSDAFEDILNQPVDVRFEEFE